MGGNCIGVAAAGDDATRGGICRSDVGLVMADALTRRDAAGKTVALVSDDKAPVDAWKNTWCTLPRDWAPRTGQ